MQRPIRGFTLFEMMAVVAMVAIVAGAAVANMSDQIREARAHADGKAMMQRIRQEHRTSKEKMRGLRLKAEGAEHNILKFEDADANCASLGNARTTTFMKTTNLEIQTEDGIACWDANGEPAGAFGGGPGGNGGGSIVPGIADDPSPLPSEGEGETATLMNVTAGIKRRQQTEMAATRAGVGPNVAVHTPSVTSNASNNYRDVVAPNAPPGLTAGAGLP